ncbi:arsenate reductase ArsC [Methanosphaerula palustris]|uniref:Protein-tyrosine phosphatase, low molecular weight n=1 Tax=Methanosphaerula palustris (strain ATCC BAA-1556 / DSM 19958 / E1-9c) TaxID=521011 RepID=B8GF35_METPE|nr:arsenate reductase ArsC [Methanosphaerula palustris]ACL17841.1 Protein-tyrosine phosphatase, low molecular weight [Methanosphaerula palustris E1-9c]
MKKRILFICSHNAARSQMAEGYLREKYGDRYEAFSAGTTATAVHPLAILVMAEIGIDISGHRSKDLGGFIGQEMDVVVTVCDAAQGICPMFPWAKETIHAGFSDPAAVAGTSDEQVTAFRSIRDEITGWIDTTFGGA